MKRIAYAFLSVLILISCSDNTTNNKSEKKFKKVNQIDENKDILDSNLIQFNTNTPSGFIKNYYYSHSLIWEKPYKAEITSLKLDSIQRLYCTDEIREKSNKDLSFGYDLLTLDNTLEVKNWDSFKVESIKHKDVYKITYKTYRTEYPGKDVELDVVLFIKILEEDGKYRIANVRDSL